MNSNGRSVFKKDRSGYGGGGGGIGGKGAAYIALALFVCCMIFGLLANSSEPPSVPDNTNPTTFTERPTLPTLPERTTAEPVTEDNDKILKKTMMLYLDGADLEENDANATDAIKEIFDSGVDMNTHNILIYTGGSNFWHNYNIPIDKDCIYQLKNNRLNLLKEYPAKNIGASDTLAEFMKYCVDNFPAEQYGLLLLDHGGGPNFGVCSDFRNGHDTLMMDELQNAFSYAGFGASKKLEFVLFDACLMASLEVAHCMSNYANYMVASENVSYVYGSDYAFMRSLNEYNSGADIGKAYVDCFYNASTDLGKRLMRAGYSVYDITYSLVDLTKMSQLERAINSYFSKVNQNNTQSTLYVRRCSENARGVMEYADSYGSAVDAVYDLVDFRDLISIIGSTNMQTEYDALNKALDEFIVYNKATTPRMGGITIYSPKNLNRTVYSYDSFNFASEYTKYVDACYKGMSTFSGFTVWNSFDIRESEVNSATGACSMTAKLTDAQQESFASAEYFILTDDVNGTYSFGDDEYLIVAGGNDATLDKNGVLTVNYDNRMAYATHPGSADVPVSSILYREKTADGNIIYNMYGSLTEEKTASANEYKVTSVDSAVDDTKFVLDMKNDKFNIVAAQQISSPDGVVASYNLVDVNDFEGIEFTNHVKKTTYNVEGQLQSVADWKNQVSGITTSYSLSDVEFVMKEADSNADYYAVIIVTDIYGGKHMTEVTEIDMD